MASVIRKKYWKFIDPKLQRSGEHLFAIGGTKANSDLRNRVFRLYADSLESLRQSLDVIPAAILFIYIATNGLVA